MVVIHGSWHNLETDAAYGGFFLWIEFSAEDNPGEISSSSLKKRKRHPLQPLNYESSRIIEDLWDNIKTGYFHGTGFRWPISTYSTIKFPTLGSGYPIQYGFLDHTGESLQNGLHLRDWEIKCFEFSRIQSAAFLVSLALRSQDSEMVVRTTKYRVRIGNDLIFWAGIVSELLDPIQRMEFIPAVIESHQRNSSFFRSAWIPLYPEKLESVIERFYSEIPPSSLLFGQNYRFGPKVILKDFIHSQLEGLVRSFYPENYRSRYYYYGDYRWSGSPMSDIYEQWYDKLGWSSSMETMQGKMLEIEDLKLRLDEWAREVRNSGYFGSNRLVFRIDEPQEVTGTDPDSTSWKVSVAVSDDGISMKNVHELIADAPSDSTNGFSSMSRFIANRIEAASLISGYVKSGSEEIFNQGSFTLKPEDAYNFLKIDTPALIHSGFSVTVPEWWGKKQYRQNIVIDVDSGGESFFSMDTLVKFNWKVALSSGRSKPVSIDGKSFEKLVQSKISLVRIGKRWIELNESMIQKTSRFIEKYGKTEGIPVMNIVRMSLSSVRAGDGDTPTIGEIKGDLHEVIEHLREHRVISQIPQPGSFSGTMRPYQVRGLSWLMFMRSIGFGCILADDMGLGKTIQAIAYMLQVKETDKESRFLVIAPLSVLINWRKELNAFAPSLRVLIHHGTKRERKLELALSSFKEYDVVITSNEMTHRDLSVLANSTWGAMIVDEAQNFKNHLTKRSKAIRHLKARHRIALSGTPIENRLTDLWAIMDFLNPGYLYSRKEFRESYELPYSRKDAVAVKELQDLVKPFILRREKRDKEIITDLPEKNEMTIYCGLTEEQAALYQAHIDRTLEEIEHSEGMQRKGKVLSMILRLKQICDHPLLYIGNGEGLEKRSEKLDRTGDMINEIIANGEKAVIFTQFTSMGRILKKYIESLGIGCELYHGGLTSVSRDRIISSFQESGGETKILIASLKAGGLGLNLVQANNVFHFDRWWNPAVENQATDRLYRIGQRRAVQVYKFVVAGTLEERIEEMLKSKSQMAGMFIHSGEEWLTELSTDRIKALVTLQR